jgi:hypothetical protein
MKLEIDPLSEQVMVKLISNRLDLETRKAYEIQLKADVLPKWNELLQILLQRCHTLESIEKRNFGAPLQVTSPHQYLHIDSQTEAFAATSDAVGPPIKCSMCEKAHYINQCSEFLAP